VVAGRVVVGILTRTDMEPHRGHYEWTAVRAAMTQHPACVAPDTPVAEVARMLVGGGFNAVPVIEGRNLVGLISRSDVLRVMADAPAR
jgi:CIC family chloride channel protein